MTSQGMTSEEQMKKNMDNMYRWTRHVYDISRKYYLLGRDCLIENLDAKNGEAICEVGCGTARNLIKMAKKYPQATFFGLDASDEMLKTASLNLKRANLENKILIKQSFSQSFLPSDIFQTSRPLDKIVFSYALSIIPPWKESINHAIDLLPSGGEIHIVDFGGQESLPAGFRKFLFWFLDKFHVYYKPEILEYLHELEKNDSGVLDLKSLYRGYTYHAIFKKK